MTENVPPWGCPWHGVVKNGKLARTGLPDLNYPQPPGAGWQASSTALIAVPDMPLPVTLPAQAAEGMQWRNTATLAGSGAVHGRALGGWLYIDPARDVWRVTTSLTSIDARFPPGAVTVTLARFGLLGGSPETYVYSVTLPDLGQSSPAIAGSNSVRAYQFDVRPDGGGAIFMLSVPWVATNGASMADDTLGAVPLGWLEIRLSGAGATCAVQVVTLKTRAQTLGAVSEAAPARTSMPVVFDQVTTTTFPAPGEMIVTSTYTPRTTVVSGDWGYDAFPVSGYGRTWRCTGSVIALWYKPAGIAELTLDTEHKYEPTHGTPAIEAGESITYYKPSGSTSESRPATISYSESAVSTDKVTLRLDGVIQLERAYVQTSSISMTGEYTPGGVRSGLITYSSPRGSRTASRSFSGSTQVHTHTADELWAVRPVSVAVDIGAYSVLMREEDQSENPQPAVTLGLYRGSNKCFGFLQKGHSPGVQMPLVTPQGLVTKPLPPHEILGFGRMPLYATYCPVTHDVALDTSAVCFV